MIGLTRAQKHMLDFIQESIAANGVPPSFEEMRVAGNFSSKSGVYRVIDHLEARGHLRRLPGRARALELTQDATVTLSPEILALVDRYAREHGILLRSTAANELLRSALDAA